MSLCPSLINSKVWNLKESLLKRNDDFVWMKNDAKWLMLLADVFNVNICKVAFLGRTHDSRRSAKSKKSFNFPSSFAFETKNENYKQQLKHL